MLYYASLCFTDAQAFEGLTVRFKTQRTQYDLKARFLGHAYVSYMSLDPSVRPHTVDPKVIFGEVGRLSIEDNGRVLKHLKDKGCLLYTTKPTTYSFPTDFMDRWIEVIENLAVTYTLHGRRHQNKLSCVVDTIPGFELPPEGGTYGEAPQPLPVWPCGYLLRQIAEVSGKRIPVLNEKNKAVLWGFED